VGILGGIVRDLPPFDFTPSNPEYSGIVRSVMGIFDKESYKQIPLEVRIEAADSLGQVGDPRLDEVSMIAILGGPFWMGAQKINKKEKNFDKDTRDRESPVHQVELSFYKISKYPVTVGQFLMFIENGGYKERRYWKAGGFGKFKESVKWEEQLRYPSRPVVLVSWYEAAAYAEWFGARLPTEAEWERAARGPSDEYRKYPWGNEEPGKDTANIFKTGIGKATPVGIFPEDCTSEGVMDMGGNVWEWCWDLFGEDYYKKCSQKGVVRDPKGPEQGGDRVLRGGSFVYIHPVFLRCAHRGWFRPDSCDVNLGFRVVRFKF
jgi:formylglycine-generating enzyme required for sulfatase activity